jgi:hypothetical protein
MDYLIALRRLWPRASNHSPTHDLISFARHIILFLFGVDGISQLIMSAPTSAATNPAVAGKRRKQHTHHRTGGQLSSNSSRDASEEVSSRVFLLAVTDY